MEISWGVHPTHSDNVLYSFDADGIGAGVATSIANINQQNLAGYVLPGTTPTTSGYQLLGTFNLNLASTFPVATVNNGYLTADDFRFTSIPEPTSLGLICLGAASLIMTVRRRRRAA